MAAVASMEAAETRCKAQIVRGCGSMPTPRGRLTEPFALASSGLCRRRTPTAAPGRRSRMTRQTEAPRATGGRLGTSGRGAEPATSGRPDAAEKAGAQQRASVEGTVQRQRETNEGNQQVAPCVGHILVNTGERCALVFPHASQGVDCRDGVARRDVCSVFDLRSSGAFARLDGDIGGSDHEDEQHPERPEDEVESSEALAPRQQHAAPACGSLVPRSGRATINRPVGRHGMQWA